MNANKSCAVGSKVAPLAGAWIEIEEQKKTIIEAASLPSRERGLKFTLQFDAESKMESLPSRERGLKFSLSIG